MSWSFTFGGPTTDHLSPIVVAASIAAAVAIATTITNLLLGQKLHRERMQMDEKLLNARAKKDAEIIEKKAASDAALEAWRRRAGFAEECLALFYEVQAVISHARLPVGFWSEEGNKRPRQEGESDELARHRERYFNTFTRLNNRRKSVETLYSMRYRAGSLFGRPAEKPFMDMMDAWEKIETALNTLFTTTPHHTLYVENAEKIVWNTSADDRMSADVSKIVEAAESYLRTPFDTVHKEQSPSDTMPRPTGPHGWDYRAP